MHERTPVSDFILRKNVTLFYRMDADRDGRVEREDFLSMGRKAAKDLGLAEAKVVPGYDTAWAAWWAPADRDGDGVVSLMEWLGVQQEMAAKDPAAFRRDHMAAAETFIRAIDTSGDGTISKREFRAWIANWSDDADVADAAFAKLDTDRDGRVSAAQMADLMWDYHTSADASAAGNWAYGTY